MVLPAVNNLNGILVSNIGLGDMASPVSPLMVQVDSTVGWPERGTFSVDEEVFFYDQSLGGTSTHFAVTYRSFDFTALQEHASGSTIQQRILAQHHQESLNQRKTRILPTTAHGETVLIIPGSLTLVEVELVVLECFDNNVELQLMIVTDAMLASPSPFPEPPTSPCDGWVPTSQNILLDFHENELTAQTRWLKGVYHDFGNWQTEHRLVANWQGPSRTIGLAEVIVHTTPRIDQP